MRAIAEADGSESLFLFVNKVGRFITFQPHEPQKRKYQSVVPRIIAKETTAICFSQAISNKLEHSNVIKRKRVAVDTPVTYTRQLHFLTNYKDETNQHVRASN